MSYYKEMVLAKNEFITFASSKHNGNLIGGIKLTILDKIGYLETISVYTVRKILVHKTTKF